MTIQKLLKKWCPNGVPYKKIGDLYEVITGVDKPKDFVRTKVPNATYKYPIYSNGIKVNAIWWHYTKFEINKPVVTFSSIGTIKNPEVKLFLLHLLLG